LLINLRKYENRTRVYFTPNLKVGVFVTLRAPDVIIFDGVEFPEIGLELNKYKTVKRYKLDEL